MQATLIPYLPRDMTLCLLPTPRSPNDLSTVNRHSRHCLPRSGSINRQAMKQQREECDACPDQMTVPCRITGSRMHQPSRRQYCLLYTSDAADEEDSVDL